MADLIKTSKVLRLNFDCSVAYGVFDKQCGLNSTLNTLSVNN